MKMKFLGVINIVILFLIFILIFSTYVKNTPTEPSQSIEITNRQRNFDKQTLTFATENYPPLQYEDNGEIKGMSVDVIREAFRRMGYTISIKIYPWSRALEMVRKGEADGTFLAFKTADRETYLDFPHEPVFLENQSFFVRADSSIEYDGQLKSIQNYKIGIVKGYDYGETFITAMNNNTIQTEAIFNNMENIDKLLNNRIDMMVDSNYVTQYNLRQRGLTDRVKMLKPPIRQAYMYLAFSKKGNIDKETIDKFDEVLRGMKKDGTYDRIMEKYSK